MVAHMSDFPPPLEEPVVHEGATLTPSVAMLLLDIGRRHYLHEESLSSIALELGLSRFKVARLVREARERGIVQISLATPENVDLAASDRIKSRWPHLAECIVIPTPSEGGPASLRNALATAAAELIMERVTAEDIFGLACGHTVNEAAARIRRLPACTIVQLTGVTSHGTMGDSSIRTMQRVAALSRGRSFPIYAPAVLESRQVVQALSREPGISAALSRSPQLTIALVTVGAWRDGESTLYAACPPDLRARVKREGAVAELMGHLLDADGRVVGSEFSERCLIAPLDDLRAVKNLVLVVGGQGRVDALRAVLNARLVTQLITDSRTADGLLDG